MQMKTFALSVVFVTVMFFSAAMADVIENDAYLTGSHPAYEFGLSSINDPANGLFLYEFQDLDGVSIEFSYQSRRIQP